MNWLTRRILMAIYKAITIKIHEYNGPWPNGYCIRCGRSTGLNMKELLELPKGMAYCPKGRRVFKFRDTFSCLLGWRYEEEQTKTEER